MRTRRGSRSPGLKSTLCMRGMVEQAAAAGSPDPLSCPSQYSLPGNAFPSQAYCATSSLPGSAVDIIAIAFYALVRTRCWPINSINTSQTHFRCTHTNNKPRTNSQQEQPKRRTITRKWVGHIAFREMQRDTVQLVAMAAPPASCC